MDVVRVREIPAELSWHGESLRLLQESGVDGGELAEAAEGAVTFIDAHIGAPVPTPRSL